MRNEIVRLLRTDFLAFARKAIREKDGTVVSKDRYLEYLATELMKVVDGETKRLVVNMPPRHLKTAMASVCLSAWILAHKPNTKILLITYTEALAREIARAIRSILQAGWFKQLFDTRIEKGHAEVMKFATTAGGEVYAASIDGSITGFGADLIIVDDPHNITDAGHPKKLASTIDRFDTLVMSRLNNRKQGRLVVIAHRIHDQDLSAHLLAAGGWTHILLPLMATRDQVYDTAYGPWHRRKDTLLRPDADDLNEVARLRATLVNPPIELLYQQDADVQALPSITAEHFPLYSPDSLGPVCYAISVDTGTDKGDRNSFSAVQTWASDGANHYLVEQFRQRCDFDDLERVVKRFCRRYGCPILVERTANGPALISKLTRKQRKRVHEITPRGSKAARFRPHIEKILAGRVHLPRNAPFYSDLVKEFVEFPHGRYTDQVDAFTQYMDWVAEQGSFGQPQPAASASPSIAVGLNSQYLGSDRHNRPKPQDRGFMAAGGNSNRMPNAPFATVKAWVKY